MIPIERGQAPGQAERLAGRALRTAYQRASLIVAGNTP